ncbi:MAG TPA: Rne/Rng family ribonuclease [Bryobacteraceae bacterium]|jgi:ribonuclease G|nr:Rne/Rng family ribonuclease [Bryobacteraceae bacterium]
MSKELIVSANRHETRVAVLEDDQVVEVYYQREKEYSLAGSIHKGRVTRVLPGMQSAFVDIGLDRDAFLYVSDFFEDNDEYDKIVTSVEEKVLKQMEKGPGSAGTPAPFAPIPADVPRDDAPAELPSPEPSAEAPAAPAAAVQAPSAPLAPPDQFARRAEERDRRGGRRGRRRRPKGRGLPESKYFSPGQHSVAVPAPPAPDEAPDAEPEAPDETAEDIVVLPGESLAKYRGETSHPAVEEIPEFAETTALVEDTKVREAATTPEPETPPEPEAQAETPEWSLLGGPDASAAQTEETPAPAAAAPTAVASGESAESAQTAEVSEAAETAELSEGSESADGETDAESAEAASAAAETAEDDQLGPEPARIPTSLTATLREQGGRYPHRVSRRMRRRGRPDGADPQQAGQAGQSVAPAVRKQDPRPDARPDARQVARPESVRPEKSAAPSISDLLREGQEIIVQIAKEPLGQKGARITSHIALPGRFLVYMPTVDHIGVSRKIPSDDERLRLKRVLQSNRTGIPGGYIVRTAGDGRTEEELRADMLFLYNLWLDMRQKAEKRPAPALIHHDLDVVERILRDQFTSTFKSVWVDNEEVYENVLGFVQRFQPALVSRVKLYTRATPIFDEYGITSELEKALRPKVWLKTGGHIVINQTEALVAIDVNTGKYVGKSNRLEDTIVKTNTDAIKEIVRQIRLRDLGGIIVVDFIDMDERKNRQKVMQVLEEAMRADRAPYKILQFNDFGLVAITRKRVKQSLERTLCVPCPTCEGSGYVKSVQTVIGEILVEAQKIARAVEGNEVMLRVNPEVAKVLKSNQNSYLQEIEEILGRTVLVKSDPLLHQEKFDLA